jgi:hypothetical protein
MMHRFTASKSGGLAVAGLFLTLLSVQPGPVAGKDAKATAPKVAAQKNHNPNSSALSARIDQLIEERLKDEKVPASPLAGDAEFLRRVSLDLTGVIPTAERAAAFLDSREPDKRVRLVDELLASPRFGRHLADIWQELLLMRNSDNKRLSTAPFIKWLEDNFNANKPWDRFVHELLTASGTQDKNGAVTYFLTNNNVDKITDNVARNLLGVQLQCAQCHNHPFTAWKQTEYWSMAAFFMKVRLDNVKQAAKTGASAGVTETATTPKRPKKNALPESAKFVPARFLQGEEPRMRPTQPYRPVLADWLTSPKNPFFARAAVNRAWAQLFGRGLVNPVDDMHDGNAPSHPQLLKELTDGFIASGFDLKGLYRTLCNSKAYQRTGKPTAGNEDAEADLYSRMAIKPFAAEQLYDSLTQVAGAPAARAAKATKGGKAKVQGGPRAQFVAAFRVEDGGDPTEYQAGIPQALRLMNSKQFNTNVLVNSLARSGKSPEQVIEHLFLVTLSRRPAPAERDKFLAHVNKAGSQQGYSDVLWVLLNSSEFTLNH